MSGNGSFVVLTLAERDRRFGRTRQFLKEHDLDCLIVGGFSSREQYDAYLTNDYAEGAVVFPETGEPTYLTWQEGRVMRQREAADQGNTPWVEDMRAGLDGFAAAAVVREKGCDSGRIGVVGLRSKGPGEMCGLIPYNFWAQVLEELAHASFVECSEDYAALMLVKSAEELALIRYSASVGEEACRVMLEMTKPGATELAVTAEIMYTIFKAAAFSPPPFLILHSGPETVSWGPPIWRYQGGKTRSFEKGDMVLAEIFPRYGGFESQQQMSIALAPVDEVHLECARVARRCYEVGLEVLRPGVSFRKVDDEMEAVIGQSGCWHITPLIHSLSPTAWVGRLHASPAGEKGKGAWESRELPVEAGMVFELEPNAQIGKHRVNIGGTVVVTESGAEELNSLPTRMHVVG